MLPFDTIHAVVGCLIDADACAEDSGWNEFPAVLVLHERRPATHATTSTCQIRLDVIAVPDRRWLEHPTGVVGVLTDLATTWPDPPTGDTDGEESDSRLLAWAVVYEDIRAEGTTDLAEVRHIDALDIDGRTYQITRVRGEDRAVVVIDDDPVPARTSATRAGLAALLGAARRT